MSLSLKLYAESSYVAIISKKEKNKQLQRSPVIKLCTEDSDM